MANGLPSNDVRCVAVDSTHIYAGTSAGLTMLERQRLSTSTSTSNLVLKKVFSTTQDHPLAEEYTFEPQENSLRFEYVCISPKSKGNITYDYKLEGLDTKWSHTKELSVSYPHLPPGLYTFILRASDINGTPANQQWSVPIRIKQYWYKSVWFIGLMNLALIPYSNCHLSDAYKCHRKT